MRAPVPLVTAAAGCGGTGPELARFGDLTGLDALLIGPIGLTGDAEPAVRLVTTPSGLVHVPAPVLPVEHVVETLLPWLRARNLRVVCAVRGSTVGAVTQTLQQLRRSLDFVSVVGVEIDLAAPRAATRPAVAGLPEAQLVDPWSVDPQACLKLLAAAREQLPRDLLLLAKLGGECPDPVATARAAVGGGARALVLSGSVPALAPGHHLVGPAVAPVTLGLVTCLHAAVRSARVPDVPLVAVGGVHDVRSARAVRAAGADGVQLGSGILADPELLWRVHDALSADDRSPADALSPGSLDAPESAEPPDRPEPPDSPEPPDGSHPLDPGGPHVW